jgi:hypothetical protein
MSLAKVREGSRLDADLTGQFASGHVPYMEIALPVEPNPVVDTAIQSEWTILIK